MNRVYNTEILSVGTEILLGHVVNSDAKAISEMLSAIGINVKYHTVVGDNPERLRECVEIAKNRADIIVTTGGLGPTYDDLTKALLAESFGLKLVRDEKEYALMQAYGNERHRAVPNVFTQSMLPEGSTVFHNTCGTAPGCAFEKDGIIVIMLPGPPKECSTMFRLSAIPYLKKLSDEQIVSHAIRIFGKGEFEVDGIFREEMDKMTNPTMAPYTRECDCLLQVTAKAKSEEEAERMLEPVIAHVKDVLGDVVFGVDVDEIECCVLELLKEKNKTFTLAESCTGGEVAKRFTDLPGASEVFPGGFVVYSDFAKAQLLGIDAELIREKTAVSREVAEQMAIRCRKIMKTDIGIGITGLAGPDGDGVNEVGTVFISMDTEDGTFVKEIRIPRRGVGGRQFIRRMSGSIAFDLIRRHLCRMEIR
ncbi:MAG: competence/damage-inducible protein A [Oscillospiraceae bacterium]|nr:competence/damage-inducible protein A [Oscillospiraceae bacterium]